MKHVSHSAAGSLTAFAVPVRFRLWGLLLSGAALTISACAGNVVTDWNQIASTVIVKNGGKPPSSSPIWFAYMNLAIYDAVNAITGQFRPFYYFATAPGTASIDAAAAAAAHRILVNYFPSQQANLDAQFSTSLAGITADGSAKDAGVAAGEAAAGALIAARTGDGLEANVPYTPGSGAGVWVPTPPAFAAAATPWLAQMRPFTMITAAEYRPDGPPTLDSETWKRDYNLTRLFGGANSSIRSAAESEIGVFWTEHPSLQYGRTFGRLVDDYGLSVPDSARLMAMLSTAWTDALIGCFDAKYTYSFWRPVTAINAGGGNSDLQADGAWAPLATTPGHPEYPSAHACATSAISTVITNFFSTAKVHVVVDSTVFQDGLHTHVFDDTHDLMDEVVWARIYAGFHYYHSLQVGQELGTTVAREMVRNHFGPQRTDVGSLSLRPGK